MNNRNGALVGLGIVGVLVVGLAGSGTLSGHATGEDIGCELVKLGKVDGAAGVRAVCDWPVPAERLRGMIERWDRHQRYFDALAENRVLGREGGVVRVLQVHQARGMSDREVVVDWTTTSVTGGKRYGWTKAGDQSALSGDNVEVEVHTGHWELVDSGEGSRVVYESRYLPGGSIPAFLVRWFQSDGVVGVLEQFREAAEAG